MTVEVLRMDNFEDVRKIEDERSFREMMEDAPFYNFMHLYVIQGPEPEAGELKEMVEPIPPTFIGNILGTLY